MRGIWTSAATIARFAVAGSLMTLMAGGQSAPKAEVGMVDSTGVAGWHSGKPDFDAFDRTTRSANELVEGCPILA
jgi:hypothetical protein